MEKVKFSIITPTYNRKELLLECIKSVQNQEKGDYEYEHLVIDDGSTDGTREAVESLKDPSVVYLHKKNEGTASAVQLGIRNASGNFISVMGDDDFLTANSLKLRTDYIKQNPDIDWFYGYSKWVNENGEPIKIGFQSEFYTDHFYERLLIENFIHGGTITVKTDRMKEIEWPNWLKRSEDYFVWLELARPEKHLKVGILKKYLYCYRVHQNAYTTVIRNKKETFRKKEQLNQKIRRLHGDNLAFLAEEAYKYRKELYEAYRTNEKLDKKANSLEKELNRVYNSRSWKVMEPLRGVKNKISRGKK